MTDVDMGDDPEFREPFKGSVHRREVWPPEAVRKAGGHLFGGDMSTHAGQRADDRCAGDGNPLPSSVQPGGGGRDNDVRIPVDDHGYSPSIQP